MRLISNTELDLLNNDPVRPHINKIDIGKQVYVLDDLTAVICICYCTGIPTNELELEEYRDDTGKVAVAYTVWSSKKGAGRTIVNNLLGIVKEKHVKKLVTLSPLTDMAERFHISNGAKLIGKSDTCQNFEYAV